MISRNIHALIMYVHWVVFHLSHNYIDKIYLFLIDIIRGFGKMQCILVDRPIVEIST